MKRSHIRLGAVVSVLAVAACQSAPNEQTGVTEEQVAQVEEAKQNRIVVTGQKRERAAQDAPMAVQGITSEAREVGAGAYYAPPAPPPPLQFAGRGYTDAQLAPQPRPGDVNRE